MQNKLHKSIYREFVYCDPHDHLMKPDNKLTRPKYNCHRRMDSSAKDVTKEHQVIIQSDITGHYNSISPEIYINSEPIEVKKETTPNEVHKEATQRSTQRSQKIIYDEDTFNQIELRGFITKQLLEQSLEKESNLFHIAEDIFDDLCDRYHQFKEILHTLTTEFDNSVACIIDTAKELTKKISHIIYELYLAVMQKDLD